MLVIVLSMAYFVHMEGKGFVIFPSGTFYISHRGSISMGKIQLNLKGPVVEGEMPSGSITIVKEREIRKFKTYRQVRIRNIQEGVDAVVVPISSNQVEIHFEVPARENPGAIILPLKNGSVEVNGTELLLKDPEGEVKVSVKEVRAFQGAREVKVKVLAGKDHIEFVPEDHDSRFPVIIDPVFSAVITGASTDIAFDMEVDPTSGAVYIAGYTSDYTTFAPSRNTAGNPGLRDLFVSKLSPDLSLHLGTLVIGGASYEGEYMGVHLARRPNGNILLASSTQDATQLGIPSSITGTIDGVDLVVFEIDSDLTSVIRSLIIGASGNQSVSDVEVLPSGKILLTGTTDTFPAFGVPETLYGQSGGAETFVMRIDSSLSAVERISILSSTGDDETGDLEVGGDGWIYIVGHTDSSSTFANGGPLYGTGPDAAFVTKLDSSLQPISTIFIGSALASSMTIGDSAIYITGSALDYTLLPAPFNIFGTPSPGTYMDAFVVGVSHDLSSLLPTAIIAGSQHDVGMDLITSGNTVIIVGNTYSTDLAPSRQGYGTLERSNIFFTKLSKDLQSHIKTLVIGGTGNDEPYAMEVFGSQLYASGSTGPYYGSISFLSGTTVMGDTSGSLEVFALSVPTTLPVMIPEKEEFRIEVKGDIIQLFLSTPAYAGLEVYSATGRLLHIKSIGYLPRGQYEFRINLNPGTYVMRLRVGDRIITQPIVMGK